MHLYGYKVFRKYNNDLIVITAAAFKQQLWGWIPE